MILSTFVAYYNKFITMNKIIITALAAILSSAAFAQQNISISVTTSFVFWLISRANSTRISA